MAARTTQQPEAPQPAEENEVTSAADLGFVTRDIEVEPVKTPPPRPGEDGYTVIRMAETIEEFTYGNNRGHVPLQAGKIYRVPNHIAEYLHALGKVYVS